MHRAGLPVCGLEHGSGWIDFRPQLELRRRGEFDAVELLVTEFMPAMGVDPGPGVLGLAFFPDQTK